jgi:DNA-binding response OmpR family regulator
MRVLVVEDNESVRDVVRRALTGRGLAVDSTGDGADAMYKLTLNDYDVVVLDRDLPGLSGDEVCRRLVGGGFRTRVLMLTAAIEMTDLVDGLALGADDYLRKPFELDELFARVVALSRRSDAVRPPSLTWHDIELDSARRKASRAGSVLRLTRKEFGVLEALLSAQGGVLSAEQILERVWDEHIDPFTNVLRITMMTLRRKLGDPPAIETVVGTGYRMAAT